jgi:hypothetical protein
MNSYLALLANASDKFWKLRAADQRVLLFAVVMIPLFWLAVRVLGLARLQSLLAWQTYPASPLLTHAEVQNMARSVNLAARRALRAPCLPAALFLQWLLMRRGVASHLRIGVRIAAGALEAHAWVECEGTPINDRADIALKFPPIAEFAPTGALTKR